MSLVILSGPSGVGKDTVLQAWTLVNPRIRKVVAYTTRAPRTGEVDGIDYNFVTREEFLAKAECGDFLEWKEVHGNLYATPLKDMESILAAGDIALLKIDVQGALDVIKLRNDAVAIFLLPPSWDELERRIRNRKQDTPEQIEKRLANARGELELADRYHVRVVNDDVNRAVAELEAIVGERAA